MPIHRQVEGRGVRIRCRMLVVIRGPRINKLHTTEGNVLVISDTILNYQPVRAVNPCS